MMKRTIRATVGLLVSALSCAALLGQDDQPDAPPPPTVEPPADSSNVELGINAPANYHLVKGDSIFINVQGEPDCSIKQTIDINGEVRPVYIDRINLENLTIREAEQLIERRYIEEKYLRDPVVRISIASYAKKVVFLQGAFARKGPFEIPGGREHMRLSDLVSYAGGLLPYAKPKVKVTRVSGEVVEVNIQSLLQRKKNAPEDILIYPGDTLWVGERIW